MTTLQPRHSPATGVGSGPMVTVAGAAWPVYKLVAVIASILTAVMVGAATMDAQLTSWLVVIVAVSSWWAARTILIRS
ncbi:hypothetical protein [Jongsikchunia kroppenstedtii]|uniref:hypothetical protein n=1 Tax=Jongsikchunia kroppenstedtii TaxID=1121721 RepID=UPI00037427F2|nr:hypothetical protein [Jongsikchunia kroppenstedtii]